MTDRPDPVAAAMQAQDQVPMTPVNVRLVTGRPAMLVVPADISDLEWLSLIGAALRVGDELRAKRPGLRLVLPQ